MFLTFSRIPVFVWIHSCIKSIVNCEVRRAERHLTEKSTHLARNQACFQHTCSQAYIVYFWCMRCHIKDKNMNFCTVSVLFKISTFTTLNSLQKNLAKLAISACKAKFGNTSFRCFNSVVRELCAICCTSNERREPELFIHVYLIKQIIYYDRNFLACQNSNRNGRFIMQNCSITQIFN